jgi:hypothetical protein
VIALGILVAEADQIDAALALVKQERGETAVFLMHEGVRAAGEARLRQAIVDGVDATLCAQDAEARGLAAPSEDDVGAVRWGSQYDHAVLVRDAARFVALTGGAPTEGRRPRRILVELGDDDSRAAQGLRSALAYASVGLGVGVVAAPGVRPLSPERLSERALSTLRALGGGDSQGTFDLRIRW